MLISRLWWLPREICADEYLPGVSFSQTQMAGTAHMARSGPHQLNTKTIINISEYDLQKFASAG